MDNLTVGIAKTDLPRLYESDLLDRLIDECIQPVSPPDEPEMPLMSGFIKPGMTVLLKPNWVFHYNQANSGRGDLSCMYTQPAFVLAALKQVFAAQPGRVIIGDAPIQGCAWQTLVSKEFVAQAMEIAGDCPLEIVDFRRTVLNDLDMVNGLQTDRRTMDHYVLFDLGSDSQLEAISQPEGRFRVTMYDPRKLAETHKPGKHQYLVAREAIDADVVLNLPKLKTHRKAGITGALKNLVGINGNKDFLPHHRVGGSTWGGDCYPGLAPFNRFAELCLDQANQRIGEPSYRPWAQAAHYLNGLQQVFGIADLEGGWHGNETVWRMILDLNRILVYGRADGELAEIPQRQVFTLTDALICGQGEGPLAPEPCRLGVVTFSNSSAAADWVHAWLLGLDPEKIPQVKHAFDPFRWPLTAQADVPKVIYQGREISSPTGLLAIGIRARPPSGWLGHCEADQSPAVYGAKQAI